MDHFWQIGGPGSELQPMLEGWTTLGFMAAHSQRARLGLMVGGVHYRNPGLWVKPRRRSTSCRAVARGLASVLPGTRPSPRVWASRSRPSPSASRCSRRPSGSPGHVARRARLGGGVRWPPVPCDAAPQRPPIDLPSASSDHDRRRWREKDPSSRRAVRRRLEPVRGPAQLVPKYQILAEHCSAVGRDFAEIERTNMQGVGLGSAGALAGHPSHRTRSSSGSGGWPRPASSR